MRRAATRNGMRIAAAVGLLLAFLAPAPDAGAQSRVPGGAWSGPYLGVHGGAAWADAASVTSSSDLAFGGHAGYGLGLGFLYAGIEADATWGGARHTWQIDPLYASRLDVDWTATLRGRLGVVAGPVLLYGTAGGAWSGETIGQHRLGTTITTATHRSTGLALGAGIEAKPLPFVSVRLEALHLDLSDRGAALARTLPSGLEPLRAWRGDLGETVVRAGVSLRLN